jgi:hypothetical protein
MRREREGFESFERKGEEHIRELKKKRPIMF